MEIIIWLVIVGVAGLVATKLTGTDSRYGTLANLVIGIIGAVLGGFLVSLFKLPIGGPSYVVTFLVALGGAIIALLIAKKLNV